MPDDALPASARLPISLTINGEPRTLSVEPWTTLLDLLRLDLELTGTKKRCDHGQCGGCTVLVSGLRVNSCLTLAVMKDGARSRLSRERLLALARDIDGSPLANVAREQVRPSDGKIEMKRDTTRLVSLTEVMETTGVDKIEEEETAGPDEEMEKKFSHYTHLAVFVEVRVDETLGVVRVTRLVDAVAAGKIINPKTARSQIIGGAVFGIGMALHEEALTDHALGRVMNHNLSVLANTDVPAIDVIFVEEEDPALDPLGAKVLGEIGIVGTAPAIANAVFHAMGKPVRNLPITLDKVLGA